MSLFINSSEKSISVAEFVKHDEYFTVWWVDCPTEDGWRTVGIVYQKACSEWKRVCSCFCILWICACSCAKKNLENLKFFEHHFLCWPILLSDAHHLQNWASICDREWEGKEDTTCIFYSEVNNVKQVWVLYCFHIQWKGVLLIHTLIAFSKVLTKSDFHLSEWVLKPKTGYWIQVQPYIYSFFQQQEHNS